MEGVFEALGDPVRRHLLELLSAGELPVGALVTAVGTRTAVTQPAVSHHLKVLREAGLVTVRAQGQRRLYAIDEAGVAAARDWLDALRNPVEMLAQPLDALATEISRGQRERRKGQQNNGRGAPGSAREAG
ncbi:ArsR/SmtB family transcription factor [Kineosporia babensis]|uniref:Metalloregulator ArsR/SmtB family transcription factor n=1 Tax=Kineosporia babensis TaxID=499548 RepID=A0A9X1SV91_9ACTN|nr:metalloregulator ArsR/SmtB family transcription factor [Kineosporia babensis]MCD5313509.1 metalloregulator ArsR/SmtB family transcription factor [Kineosporia babensis]